MTTIVALLLGVVIGSLWVGVGCVRLVRAQKKRADYERARLNAAWTFLSCRKEWPDSDLRELEQFVDERVER